MKFATKHIAAFVAILFLAINPLQSAVLKGTVIATVDGLVRVEDLCVGSQVIGFDFATRTTKQVSVVALNKRTTKSVVLIATDHDVIVAAADQQLYDPVSNNWVTASNLTSDNYLMGSKVTHIKCRFVTVCNADEEIFTVYDISMAEPHNFFATEAQVLTHNVIPIVVGVGIAFGETIASISLGEIVVGIGSFVAGLAAGKVAISLTNPGADICFKDPLSRQDKKDHILQGKHNWPNLVPDPNNNWDRVVEIIAAVMASGAHRVADGKTSDVYVASATVGNRVVEVTYRIINGVKTISDAWVKP